MNSAARKRSSRSVRSSSGYSGGDSGSAFAISALSAASCVPFSADTGTIAANAMQLRDLGQPRHATPPCRPACPPCSRRRSPARRAAAASITARSAGVMRVASRTSTTASTSARLSRTARFRRSLRRERCWVWKPGVSTKTNCASRVGRDAGDPVARRLRLLRRDADLLPDQRVQQRRLADARPADDGDVAAAKCRAPLGSTCGHVMAVRPLAACWPRSAATPARPPPPRPPAPRRAGWRLARGDDRERRDPALDLELLRVRLAGRRGHHVFGHRQRRACSHSCSRVFGSLPSVAGIGVAQHVARSSATIDARAPRRSRRRGTPRRTRASSASARIDGRSAPPLFSFAFAQADRVAEPEPPRDARQRVLVDEPRAHARQVALGQRGKALVQRRADDAVEHRVADELQPLVVRRAEAAVGQRLAQQVGLAKRVAQLQAQRFGHPVRAAALPRRGRVELQQDARVADQRAACSASWPTP